MFGIPGPIGTVLDLLIVVIGFGLIVFFHECGHFFAARWAGIRVLAFAIGFGPAAFSFRKGLGLRRGSTEPEYQQWLNRRATGVGSTTDPARVRPLELSPTEYRFNWLPFGGYVKMLGQDDMNPAAVSSSPDSYQNCVPWKRMVVISAGVVMNMIIAAVLFVFVFMAGLKVEPAIIGEVEPTSPASTAVPVNAEQIGIETVGLQPGDRVLEVNGHRPNSYADFITSVAMTGRGEPVDLLVDRKGNAHPLRFEIKPESEGDEGLLSLGTHAAYSLTFSDLVKSAPETGLAKLGIEGVKPRMAIIAADGQTLSTYDDLVGHFSRSQGRPVAVKISSPEGAFDRTLQPQAEFQTSFIAGADPDSYAVLDHVLGLTPVLRVSDAEGAITKEGKANGLEPGDIFARIGNVEFPGIAEGIRVIRASAARDIDVAVLRHVDGQLQRVEFEVHVSKKGRVGFTPGDTRDIDAMVALPPTALQDDPRHRPEPTPAAALITVPGQRIVAIEGQSVRTLVDVRTALQKTTAAAAESNTGADVHVTLEWPLVDGPRTPVVRTWSLSADDVQALHALSWQPPLADFTFDPVQVLLKASSPTEAISTGLSETRRVLITTYLTFVRLFERTLKIENLKGPVGIAHIGTLLAGRGFVWLLFFMALISVNLAVINFLPLPIVDGGQFLMIVYEQIRGRPVPIPIQNAVTMAGFVLIASLFLIVTFNDVKNLLGL